MNELEYITHQQRTVFDRDNMTAYAWRVRKYFVDCAVAIDIGCGLGYQTAKLSELLPDIHFIMLDKTGDEQPIAFSKNGYTHNNLELTKQYAQKYINGSVYNVDEYKWNHSAQVIYSTLSWGWHYPVEVYLDQVLKISPKYIILDSRAVIDINHYQLVDSFRINRKENTLVFERNQ